MKLDLVKIPSYEMLENTNLSYRLSNVYEEIAQEHFETHRELRSRLTNTFNAIIQQYKQLSNAATQEILSRDLLPNEIADYIHIFDDSKSLTDNIFSNLNDSLEFASIMLKNIRNTDVAKCTEISIEDNDYIDINAVIKAGVTAIAFEAFACEALINEELVLHLSKNQLNKLEKTKGQPKYITKINKLYELYKKGDQKLPDEILTKLGNLLKKRNKIAHFKEFNYDLIKIFNHIEKIINDEEIDEFYAGDLLDNLSYYNDIFSHLKSAIDKIKG